MKKRKGYKLIVVDGRTFQYVVSVAGIFIYDSADQRHAVNFQQAMDITRGMSPAWRGKHKDGGWGKSHIAAVIQAVLMKTPAGPDSGRQAETKPTPPVRQDL